MSPASLSPTVDTEEQAQASVLKTLLATTQHFCPCPRPLAGVDRCVGSFTHLFTGVSDPRRPELITYPLPAVLFAGLLMFVCRLGARRQIGLMFRDHTQGNCI
jgi:hypothetical protein